MRTAFLALVITRSISYSNVSPLGDSYEISLELFRLRLMPATPAWNFTGIRNNIFSVLAVFLRFSLPSRFRGGGGGGGGQAQAAGFNAALWKPSREVLIATVESEKLCALIKTSCLFLVFSHPPPPSFLPGGSADLTGGILTQTSKFISSVFIFSLNFLFFFLIG